MYIYIYIHIRVRMYIVSFATLYPLVISHSLLKLAIEISEFSHSTMVDLSILMLVYQRVNMGKPSILGYPP